ncbi:RimJ/RimL family protein N-acetyltransferase [Saccharothrix tamanrassetensis]|uniref:RimJ/RimL family protein N-acetyltransferase n=1 Tax=Saccharothrix tamanrassetensis TaxID=1051531 RepID=A0A841CN44_9PSEU|nr:GNAT family protein [Saccharothrix tamanrassetensis]MBB5958550.1 RimJ/RimL family protein N-acetyltransferase [Saccharothrix tamanrassetensis]
MLFPYSESKRITLTPATSEDGPEVYDVLFRLGRQTLPPLEVFLRDYTGGFDAQFLVRRRDDGELVGVTSLADQETAGHILASVHVNAEQPVEIAADAAALTVNFAFANWRLRKVYIHSHEEDLAALGFAGENAAIVREEAVLPDHLYFHGRLWDMHVYAIYREQWDEYGIELLNHIV